MKAQTFSKAGCMLAILSCSSVALAEVPQYPDWPSITSPIPIDPVIEQRITDIMATMSLAEKIGQMTQPEIQNVNPGEVKSFHLGSVLNGGGSWPGKNKNASVNDWLSLADGYWDESMDASDGNAAIPLIWGTDAVHGHNNVIGATLFPHNIGLGAANDPDLIKRIGAVTAKEVTVTGIDWTFAPTLAVVRDDHWGRSYEGYSEDPEIVRAYGGQMVEGLQGNFSDDHVVATAKHFIGDGGTDKGVDTGNNLANEDDLRNIHGQGYFTALGSGAQTVMATFNSWQGEKIHGHEYLLNQVLKVKMGFDGFIVSDWNGIGQVAGCTADHCAQAINAGIDMIMVPDVWKQFIANTISDVNNGAIPMSRIDDAVRRILRVKIRSGLFDGAKPSQRLNAGNAGLLGHSEHRAVAREAVRKSLVLLKNNNQVLPINHNARVFVAGSSANNMAKQNGGWTISWQGDNLDNSDFPNGDTILTGIQNTGATVTFNEQGFGASTNDHDVAIVIFGEDPYAEGFGDINIADTLTYSKIDNKPDYQGQLDVLKRVKQSGVPTVAVFLSGRPLYVNEELNHSDAFVAAWLPGSEGAGVADVLFKNNAGQVNFDFTGKLSFSWPADACQSPINRYDTDLTPQFAYGYGLTYASNDTLSDLPVDDRTACSGNGVQGVKIYDRANISPWTMKIADPSNWAGEVISGNTASLPNISITKVGDQNGVQWAALKAEYTGEGQLYSMAPAADLSSELSNASTLSFDLKVDSAPTGDVFTRIDCGWPCAHEINLKSALIARDDGTWHNYRIPLSCFADGGVDFTKIDTGFLMYTDAAFTATVANIRWVPNTANGADVLTCEGNLPAPSIVVQAENYANAFDTTPGNTGGAGPAGDVDIEASGSSIGGLNVGWTEDGEWLEYTVNVDTAGTYQLSATVASPFAVGNLSLLVDGNNAGNNLSVPNTEDWQNWTTINGDLVTLSTGSHTIRVNINSGGFNLHHLTLTLSDSNPGQSFSVLARDYTTAHDTTTGNAGGQYRNGDVDIEISSLGGHNVGWTDAGEWLDFAVNVPAAGSYQWAFRVASLPGGGSFRLLVDGSPVTQWLSVGATGNWQDWQSLPGPTTTLTAGAHTLRIEIGQGGFNLYDIQANQP